MPRYSKSLAISDAEGIQGYLRVRYLEYSSEGRPVYHYRIEDAAGQPLDEGSDLRGGVGDEVNAVKAMATLLGFLGAAAESYEHDMRTGREGENTGLFSERAVEWAYQMSEALEVAAMEMDAAMGVDL